MATPTLRLNLGAIAMAVMTMLGPACSQNGMPHAADVPDAELDEQPTGMINDHDDINAPDTARETQPEVAGDQINVRQAVLAGGCFWCVEAVYEQIEGVSDVESGYIGGSADTANYDAVCTKTTGHAEAVRITYNPEAVSFGDLLKVFFTVAHDPTQLNRQGNDRGPQYRSAIFPRSDEQRGIARAYIDQLNATGQFPGRIVTTIEDASVFYPAETVHQDFARNNPNHRYIRNVSQPKVEHLIEELPEMLRGNGE